MKTQKDKDEAFNRAKQIIAERGYNDNYGGKTASDIKKRLITNTNRKIREYTYTGDHVELWGNDVSGEELLKLAYGEKK